MNDDCILIKNIPELNSPNHIFDEWKNLSQKQENQLIEKKKIPLTNNLQDAEVEIKNEISLIYKLINEANKRIYAKILSFLDSCFDFIYLFDHTSTHKIIRDNFNVNVKNIVEAINNDYEISLKNLSLVKYHTEFLANPQFFQNRFFYILNSLLDNFYRSIMQLIYDLKKISQFIPLQQVIESASQRNSISLSSGNVNPYRLSQSIFYPKVQFPEVFYTLDRTSEKTKFLNVINNLEKLINKLQKINPNSFYKIQKKFLVKIDCQDPALRELISTALETNDQLFYDIFSMTKEKLKKLKIQINTYGEQLAQSAETNDAKSCGQLIYQYCFNFIQFLKLLKRWLEVSY